MLWIAFPSYPQVTNQSVQDFPQLRLKKIAKELGVPLLDTLPLLREAERSNPKLLFLDQCHHTVLGNDLIAMWVHEFLSKELSAE
jgi:lysophospholipase L1-like esterase